MRAAYYIQLTTLAAMIALVVWAAAEGLDVMYYIGQGVR